MFFTHQGTYGTYSMSRIPTALLPTTLSPHSNFNAPHTKSPTRSTKRIKNKETRSQTKHQLKSFTTTPTWPIVASFLEPKYMAVMSIARPSPPELHLMRFSVSLCIEQILSLLHA